MEVLVLRGEDEFSHRLSAARLSVINCPVIHTEPLEDLSGLRNALGRRENFDGVFITSSTAAKMFADHVRDDGFGGRVFVLGRRSFEVLKEVAPDIVFFEAAKSAAEMLDLITVEDVRNKRFLFVRGERSMRTIPERLSGIADVEEVAVYRTVNVVIGEVEKRRIRDKAIGGEIGIACFFSPSGVDSYVKQFGAEILGFTKLAAIGETTAEALRTFGRDVDVVAESPDRFAESVIQHLERDGKGVCS